nr:MAG TPA: minor tail protein [Caudoviricetes sp.]
MNIEEMTLKIRADFSEVQNIGNRIAAEFQKVKEAISKASEAGDDLQRRARRMGQSMDQAARASQSSMGKAAQSTTTFGRKLENLKRRILDIARSSGTINRIGTQFRRVGSMASSAANMTRSGFSRISSALRDTKNKISDLIQKIRSIGKESRNAGGQASRNMDQIGDSASRAANQANDGFSRLSGLLKGGLAIFLGGKAIQAITQFGKSCIDLGSDLAEVQNVVDTTFPHMSAQIDQFSKSAIEQFGLSETVAKNYSSTFGAMARAFGFSEQQAYDMGTALTGLSGDVASFYNISTDEAYTKLKSVFTGETETLKDLGVVMTQNALDQYALQEGYGKTTAKMTEQEKVALRLAFVQEKLSLASGDFAKTADSWANQVRVLKLRFDSLKATLGQGLINILTPVIKIINSIVARLSVLAEAFLRFTEMITGKKAQSNPVGNVATGMDAATDSTNDYTDAANGAGDAASKSANKAEAAAKKIQRSVMGFDKLNKLNEKPKSDDTSGSNTGGTGTGLTGAMNDALNNTDQKFADSAKKITDAFNKLRETARPTTEAIKKLWNEGLKKLGDFTWDTIKDFWNNFLKPMGVWMLSDNAGLPRFFRITNDLLNEIDWNRLNKSLEQLFLALQKPAKFTWNALMDFYEYFLKPVAVWAVGDGLKQLSGIFTDLINAIDWDKLNKALSDLWKALAPFAVKVGQGLIDFARDVAKAVAPFVNTVGVGFIKVITNLVKLLMPFADKIGYLIGISVGLKGVSKVVSGVSGGFKLLNKILTSSGIAKAIGGIAKIISGSKIAEMFEVVATKTGTLGEAFAVYFPKFSALAGTIGSALSGVVTAIGTFIAGLSGPVLLGIAAAIAGIIAIVCNWDKVKEFFTKTLPNWWINTVIPWFKSLPEKIAEVFKIDDAFVEKGKDIISGIKTGYEAIKSGELLSWAGKKVDEFLNRFSWYKKFKTRGKDIISGVKGGYEALKNGTFLSWAGNKVDEFLGKFTWYQKFKDRGKDIISGVKEGYETIKSGKLFPWIGNKIDEFLSKYKWYNDFKKRGKDIISGVKDGYDNFKKGNLLPWIGDKVKEVFGKFKWFNDFKKRGQDIIKGIKDGYDKYKKDGLFGSLFDLGENLVKKFIKGFENWRLPKFKIYVDWEFPKGIVGKAMDAMGLPGIPHLKWNFYAEGGMPDMGELFVANEAGPEMIGRMGRQNVVANNNQITTGIRNAVVDAMVQVMMNNSSNEERQIVVENKFMVDSETFYRMTQKGKLKADRRYHVVTQM